MYRTFLLFLLFLISSIAHSQNLIPYLDRDAYGFSDPMGNVKIPAQFDEVLFFNKDSVANVRKGEYWSLINTSGKVLFPFDVKEQIRLRYVFSTEKILRSYLDHGKDTIHHLRMQSLSFNSYRILNTISWTSSPVYTRYRDKNHQRGMDTEASATFRYGLFIGRVSDSLFNVLNSEGDIILTSFSTPIIWNDSLITYQEVNKSVIFNLKTGNQSILPYTKVYPVGNGNYFIVPGGLPVESKKTYQFESKNKKGIVDRDGNIILEMKYDELTGKPGWPLIATLNNEVYFIDLEGRRMDTMTYRLIYDLSDTFYYGQLINEKWVILDHFGRKVIPDIFDDFNTHSSQYYQFRIGNQVGILSHSLTHVISYPAEDIYKISEDGFFTFVKNGKQGLINSKRTEIIPAIYDECLSMGDSVHVHIKEENKEGLMKTDGTTLFEPIYESVKYYREKGLLIFSVKLNGFYSYYDEKLNLLADSLIEDRGWGFSSMNWRSKDDVYHFTTRFGKAIGFAVNEFNHGWVTADSTELALLYKGDRVYIMRANGEFVTNDSLVLHNDYQKINIEAGLFGVISNEKEGVINHNAEWIIPLANQNVLGITEHIIVIKRNNDILLYKPDGTRIHHKPFTKITTELYGRFWRVERKGKFGFINSANGKIIVPPMYDDAWYYEKYATLTSGTIPGKKISYLIDTLGQVVIKTYFDDLYPLNGNEESSHFEASLAGNKGVIDIKGKVVIPIQYLNISGFADTTFFRAISHDKIVHYINRNNEDVLRGTHSLECYEPISLPNHRYTFCLNQYSVITDHLGQVLKIIPAIDITAIRERNEEVSFLKVTENAQSYLISAETLVEYRRTD